MNYSENNAESLHKIHPDWKIYGSETSSAVKSRGIWYEPEKYDNGANINSHYGKQQSDYGNNRVEIEEKLQLNLENLIVIINDMLVNSFELDLITLVNQLLDMEKSDDE
ncbi:hypothetical protein [Mycoplasmopsis cynos]|uniref:hypothetical protein n=1 Tax=Mycoplasmopsis cynos TaxID=171284 RepID=UPI0021FAD521|nr:hypothetical protein [Mycoplasmopsis cynos]UWV92404.1 hypothetical protein NWE57_06125 [Mycoplasmopsis cynos]